MRDAINDEVVLRRIVVLNAAETDVFGHHVPTASVVNSFDYCFRERHFPAYKNSYPLHSLLSVLSRKSSKILAAQVLVKQASGGSAYSIHAIGHWVERGRKGFFSRACVTIRPQCLAFPGWR